MILNKKRSLIKELGVILFFVFIIGIIFFGVFKGTITFILFNDTSNLIYPNYYYIAQTLKNMIWPLWDPHIFSGFSLAGYPQYGLFYPINILFWIFPYNSNPFPPYAYEYLVIFHVFLAGWFMYLLGRGLKFNRYISNIKFKK